MRARGQALIETALCLPILLIIALGTAAVVRVADARSGLDAACAAAVATAARAPGEQEAISSSQLRFRTVAAGYPLLGPAMAVSLGDFTRGEMVTAQATAAVDLSFAPLPRWVSPLRISSAAQARIDQWRTRF